MDYRLTEEQELLLESVDELMEQFGRGGLLSQRMPEQSLSSEVDLVSNRHEANPA